MKTFAIPIFAFAVTILAAWVTHIIVAIQALLSDTGVEMAYGFLLVAGAIIPPVGVIHGIGIWFGAW